MMKNKRARSASEEAGDINISPLIDMVFILLIFFIVTTVFVKEPGVEVERAQAINTQDLEKNVILIAVTDDNAIHYGGRQYTIKAVRGEVQRLLNTNADYPVIIQADKRAHAGTIINLVNECKLAKAKFVHVSTVN